MTELRLLVICALISILVTVTLFAGWAVYVMPSINQAADSFADQLINNQ